MRFCCLCSETPGRSRNSFPAPRGPPRTRRRDWLQPAISTTRMRVSGSRLFLEDIEDAWDGFADIYCTHFSQIAETASRTSRWIMESECSFPSDRVIY